MKQALFILLLLLSKAYAQNTEDRKIVITVSDSSNIAGKVKSVLVRNNFIVKELPNKDTLLTYPNEFGGLPGFTIVQAVNSGNTITLSGVYGLKRMNDWGYTANPKNFKQIMYFRGSKGWKLLEKIANDIGGQLSYSK
jgi:hypothetical protein